MFLLVHSNTRKIHDASDVGTWEVAPAFEIVEVPGSVDGDPDATPPVPPYAWPNESPTRCMLDTDLVTIIPDPSWSETQAFEDQFDQTKDIKTIAVWARNHFNQIHQKMSPVMPAITPAQMRDELLAIRKQLGK
jgi:hypothetical protein